MKVNEELSLLVLLEKSRMTKDGKAPIIIRMTIEGKRAELSLGQKAAVKSWNQEAGCVKGASQEATLINNAISMAKLKLRKHYEALKTDNDFVSVQMVRVAYQGKQEKSKGLVECIDLVIQRVQDKVSKGKRSKATLTKWNTTRDKARSFIKHAYKQCLDRMVNVP